MKESNDIPYATPVYAEAAYIPSAPPSVSPIQEHLTGIQNDGGAMEFLSRMRWPPALQKAFIANLKSSPIHFFVLDDSGSMTTGDGKKLTMVNNQMMFLSCSRWAELGEAMRFHVGFASEASAPTEFRLLNGMAPVRIGYQIGENPYSGQQLLQRFENSPGGGTPLCRHINAIVEEIRVLTPSLRAAGQRACVVIATDGESSDGDIATALRPLKDLPAWVVIRLCTNEDRIVNYWNEIDSVLELDMDVIDDLRGEATEVQKANPWLNYNDVLHKMREYGVSLKEFDVLDEKLLSLEQFKRFCKLIFGDQIDTFPLPEVDFPGFVASLSAVNATTSHVWSPTANKMTEWLNMRQVKACYGPKSGCIIM